MNTTPKPNATKKSKGELVGPPPPPPPVGIEVAAGAEVEVIEGVADTDEDTDVVMFATCRRVRPLPS